MKKKQDSFMVKVDGEVVTGSLSNNKENKKTEKNNKWAWCVHALVNVCLVAIVFVTMAVCGYATNQEVVATFKSYNGVIYAGDQNDNKVALMINVYWGTEYLLEMLDALDKYEAKATFFVGKTWVNEFPGMLRTIYDRGHEVGNHGSYHKNHELLSYDENLREIQGCTMAVSNVITKEMTLFTPPSGSYNKHTLNAAKDLGYTTVLWTRDTIDWRDRDEELIYKRAIQDVKGGDIILMHPTMPTKEALPRILEYIKSKKLVLDTVSNTIKL
ncbi:MAG: polysaccharide deacetylase family protein [Clostridia bacterium]|nr:polysaccharide deacetylase family protein [Clostridia bacterium]